MAGDGTTETLEQTPTWVVAVVCTVIVFISLAVERSLHYLGKTLKRKKQDALFHALEKLKEELMLLGFISLLLTVFQNLISNICIPRSYSYHMLPCKLESSAKEHESYPWMDYNYGRRLLSSGSSSHCTAKGKVPLLSLEALHQLHIFIFVLAVVHVVFSASTMVLGGAKIREWKHWEVSIQKETTNQGKNNNQVDDAHHSDFVTGRARSSWKNLAVIIWMVSFFKQFHASVTKSDYKALRAGFINRHCPSNKQYDFHKYMLRTLEDDFKRVVGISWYLWLFVVLFLLLNIHGWHTYFWLSFLPLVLLLAVGAKLEHIITKLAMELSEEMYPQNQNEVNRVKPSDEHFWFNKPGIILYLIQFILFQNSFEIAFFFWIWTTYGFDSCIMESIGYLIPRLVIGVIIQVLCSYSTLPLYAIVSQMGDMFKQSIFHENMQLTLHGWAAEHAKKRKENFGFASLLHFGKKKKGESEIQMQSNVTSRASGSSQDAQRSDPSEGIVSVRIESPQPPAP
ncbi:MLO-like protein 13 isoform X1 [Zingiber officinale]|uniref:MLO-like protein 13 isoform X1 n=3 Tax=Zingiber officinale TaxID=94328 RepID=UPI001C4AE3BE|nr:MLO-like protein 13 isoform X1 [Zingiber officinale]